ncbi:uncharacterized protein LOC131876804 [Tigriopus californicus]|uniref:uncharacterized protein LOC131876804 n=1 Tax=Tigriopus californicus TaxID=6832 RepID=UPI0027DA0DD6|nr:uncharacterized protein LOC131876804 [Tigriopus californicus]
MIWKAGKSNPADFFSRNATPLHCLDPKDLGLGCDMEKVIYATLNGDVFAALTPAEVNKYTRRDKQLTALKKSIHNGTLTEDPLLRPFKKVFRELTISEGGNVLRGPRIVVPKGLQERAVSLAHGGSHLRTCSMKRRLRTVAWFPAMDTHIETHVQQCKVCLTITEKATKVEQRCHATPERAWEAVSIDHFGPLPNNSHVLVVRSELLNIPRIPGVATELVKNRDSEHRSRAAQNFNRKVKTKPSSITIGQLVILRDQTRGSKFTPKFKACPYRVLNREGHATFLLRNESTNQVLTRHEDDMKIIPEQFHHHTPLAPRNNFPFWLSDPPRDTLSVPVSNPTQHNTSKVTPNSGHPHPSAERPPMLSLDLYKPSPNSARVLDKALERSTDGQGQKQPTQQRPCRAHRPPDRLGFGRVHPMNPRPRVSFSDDLTIIPDPPAEQETSEILGVLIHPTNCQLPTNK